MSALSIFVACPYTLFPMDDYKKVFEKVARNLGVSFKFADEQITNQFILKKISDYIRNHDFSLFDITGWNPNVALELGIAVGLDKAYFILLNTKIETNEVPSDIKGIDRIQYSSNSELEAKLILLVKQKLPVNQPKSDSIFSDIENRIILSLDTHPGLGINKLSELVSEDKVLIQSVVRSMLDGGKIKKKGQKKGTKYYTKDTDLRKLRGAQR